MQTLLLDQEIISSTSNKQSSSPIIINNEIQKSSTIINHKLDTKEDDIISSQLLSSPSNTNTNSNNISILTFDNNNINNNSIFMEEETKQMPIESIIKNKRPSNIHMEGELFKRSRYLHTWRQRWIVLQGQTIYSYKCDLKYQQPTEIIHTSDITSIVEFKNKSNDKYSNAFELILPKMVFTFAANTKASQIVWVTEFRKIIALNKACVTYSDKNGAFLSYGCEHFKRNCSLYCSCCKNWYFCSYCHDIQEDGYINGGHQLDRQKIELLRCVRCGNEQSSNTNECLKCSLMFAVYFCDICKFWDNDKSHLLYHCLECGVCRSGERKNYKHCDRCGVCLELEYFEQHKCMENSTKCDCPICGDYLHMSNKAVTFWTVCGHAIHVECMEEFLVYDTLCPVCRSPWMPI